jgi:hypothetical protein
VRREAEEDWGKMKSAQPTSVTIQQIEFELEKVDRGIAMPYDAERVRQLRSMLREARKQKLSAGLRATADPRSASACDGHHEMSDCDAAGEPFHSGAESIEPASRHQRLDGLFAGLTEKDHEHFGPRSRLAGPRITRR